MLLLARTPSHESSLKVSQEHEVGHSLTILHELTLLAASWLRATRRCGVCSLARPIAEHDLAHLAVWTGDGQLCLMGWWQLTQRRERQGHDPLIRSFVLVALVHVRLKGLQSASAEDLLSHISAS